MFIFTFFVLLFFKIFYPRSCQIQIILNRFIWTINLTLMRTTTLRQSEPWSYDNEQVLHTHQISRTGASPPDEVYFHTYDTSSWSVFTSLEGMQLANSNLCWQGNLSIYLYIYIYIYIKKLKQKWGKNGI